VKLNPVDPQLDTAWFQPLNLSSEELVSKFAFFKFNLCRYTAYAAETAAALTVGELLQGGAVQVESS
jgi:hypothetical protein